MVVPRSRYPSRGYSSQNRVTSYSKPSEGVRHHRFTEGIYSGTFSPLNFKVLKICRFRRSFSSSTYDKEPAPDVGNTYQTYDVMNGSRIFNLDAKIHFQNRSSATAFLEVYMIALSFFDALIWHSASHDSPVEMVVSTSSTKQGEVDLKPNYSAVADDNVWNNSSMQKRFMQKVGTVSLSGEQGSTGEFTLPINSIPPKCRRSQTGMFFGFLVFNPLTKNGNQAFSVNISSEVEFDESPSSHRLPYWY